jgi:hypothetical protein
MSHVESGGFSITANNVVAIFRVDVCWGFRKPYIQQAVGGKWKGRYQIGRTEERSAIQLVASMWLRSFHHLFLNQLA